MKSCSDKYILHYIFKRTFPIIFILSAPSLNAQQRKIDSLKNLITNTKADKIKINLLEQLGQAYRDEKKLDSSIHTYNQALELNEKMDYSPLRQCYNISTIDYLYYVTGNYTKSLEYASKALVLSEKLHDLPQMAHAHQQFGFNYTALGDYRQALNHYFKAKELFERHNHPEIDLESPAFATVYIGYLYLKMNQPDSAFIYVQNGYKLARTMSLRYVIDYSLRILGDISLAKNNDQLALNYYRQYANDFYKYNENNRDIGFVLNSMSKIFQKNKRMDSAVFYAKKAMEKAREYGDQENIYSAATSLYNFYKDKNGSNTLTNSKTENPEVNIQGTLSKKVDSLKNLISNTKINTAKIDLYEKLGDAYRYNEAEAFRYFKIAAAAKDSMASLGKIRQIQMLTFNEQMREKQQAEADAKEAATIRLIIIIASIIGLILSFLVWNRIRQLRLKHKMILEQKEAEKLRAIDKMKEKFFTNITHELRTPLSLIVSPVELYLKHPEQLNDTPRLLEGIYKNAGYLLDLINHLLDISKLDAGKMNISLSKGNFGNYIGDLVKTFDDGAEKKQIKLHTENNLDGVYLFDAEQWKKIVNNLLSNALKFTPANGSIFVYINKISFTNGSCAIRLSVRDTGIGINKEQLPFITDRFYQADNNLTRKYEGAGIGLSLVNELVKLMDGTLEIDSEEGKGSTFTIEATLLSGQGAEGFPDVHSVATGIPFSNNGKTQNLSVKFSGENVPVILVAEDNAELREFLQHSIEHQFRVIIAPDGAAAFNMALSEIPDMIISDVMMPVMDGFDFCDKIKSDPATSHIPFIMLTAKTNFESKIRGLQKGADDYLTKPFSVDELLSKIKNILDRQEKLRRHYLEQLTSQNSLPSFTEMQDGFLKNTYKIIQDNIDNSQFSVEFLAKKMAFDTDVLNKKFSSVIGLSANELIRQYKAKKAEMEHQILELEAKALRAQMNPHFIFNCMNSIKSLIQQKDEDKAVSYLTTFSKLIRTIFQNSDKREITLYDEIETCRLYTQLEGLRFGNKFSYNFFIDDSIDLKSLLVPALIIQPFIENAIWHGIMPKEDGGCVNVSVKKDAGNICCIIDDDGIGREMSKQNKFKGNPSTHQSKGVHLTQSRLDLDNLLNERSASLAIIDKKDEDGKAAGTTVVLDFKEY
ncbi:MAG: ATP-binding protein [Ginsengibacter sp.]